MNNESGIEKYALIQSYGQNKIDYEIMAISFVFWAYFWPKMTTPMGPQR